MPANNHHVEATGTLAQAEAAFATNVHRYAYKGRLLDAPSTNLSVPAVARRQGPRRGRARPVGRLHTPAERPAGHHERSPRPRAFAPGAGAGAPPPDAFVNAPPCSTYFGEKTADQYPAVNGQKVPFAPCGYTPSQYQGAYGTAGLVAKGIDGRGSDRGHHRRLRGADDPRRTPTPTRSATASGPSGAGQFDQILPKRPFQYGFDDTVNGDLCGEQGWYGEETLDVEAVHAMAPGANVLYVAARNCLDDGFLAALNKIVERRRADIITNSWDDLEQFLTPDLQQAYRRSSSRPRSRASASLLLG